MEMNNHIQYELYHLISQQEKIKIDFSFGTYSSQSRELFLEILFKESALKQFEILVENIPCVHFIFQRCS